MSTVEAKPDHRVTRLSRYTLRIVVLSVCIAFFAGSASAVFLHLLEWASTTRTDNRWLIALLPIAGFVVGFLYYRFGQDVERGNNQILEEFYTPQKRIPLKMAPFVLFGTVATHICGGSAGREGTAVQMGGAIADAFSRFFDDNKQIRRLLLIMGVSAGFASVFGTPIAGAVFALEVFREKKIRYEAILPSFLVAFLADKMCHLLNAPHVYYMVDGVPNLTVKYFIIAIIAGAFFAIASILFSKCNLWVGRFYFYKIKYAPFRPFFGGAFVSILIFAFTLDEYAGLGIPMIQRSFVEQMPSYTFALKIALTVLTLGAGFKGGEVTPLFFIGASLGSALSIFLSLPVSLLAAMGFVAVFAGATKTPIACILMGIELFGVESTSYLAIACLSSYAFSGSSGIYEAQMLRSKKKLN